MNENSESRTVRNIRIEDNTFSGHGVHVLLEPRMENVRLTGNRFLGGSQGVKLNFPNAGQAVSVLIANNTFFKTTCWLGLGRSDASQQGITICNNLILQSLKVDTYSSEQRDAIGQTWEFRANWWEPNDRTPSDPEAMHPFAKVKKIRTLASRNPASLEFLRPVQGSPIATAGAGQGLPNYIGALAPVAARSK